MHLRHMAGGPGGAEAARGRRFLVLILAGMVIAVGVLWALYMCDFATYSCPANGCGDIPQRNCEVAATSSALVVAFGAALLGLYVLLASLARRSTTR